MIESADIIPVQGETESGHEFGYIKAESGGFFFTWKYTPDAKLQRDLAVDQIVSTIEADETDTPTGRGNLRAQAGRALREYIRQHGIRRIPASAK